MVISEMRCGMCGHRFQVEIIDRDDPKEKYLRGTQVRCEKCRSDQVTSLRVVRRVLSRAS